MAAGKEHITGIGLNPDPQIQMEMEQAWRERAERQAKLESLLATSGLVGTSDIDVPTTPHHPRWEDGHTHVAAPHGIDPVTRKPIPGKKPSVNPNHVLSPVPLLDLTDVKPVFNSVDQVIEAAPRVMTEEAAAALLDFAQHLPPQGRVPGFIFGSE